MDYFKEKLPQIKYFFEKSPQHQSKIVIGLYDEKY